MLQIHLKTKDRFPHACLYPSTDLAQFHGTVFVCLFFSSGSLTVFTIFFPGFLNFSA
jgi:hypothetical protein